MAWVDKLILRGLSRLAIRKDADRCSDQSSSRSCDQPDDEPDEPPNLPSLPSLPSFPSLPTELLLSILDFLSVSDRACLSLCNRALRNKLGATSKDLARYGKAQGNTHSRPDFLLRLSRDSPGAFYCFDCRRLHPSVRTRPPGPLFCPDPYRFSGCFASDLGFYYHFTNGVYHKYHLMFQHVQLAMARYRYGVNDGIALDTLSYTEVRVSDHCNISILFSVEPRIISNGLYLRMQHCILFDHGSSSNVARWATPKVCTHYIELAHECRLPRPCTSSRETLNKIRGTSPPFQHCPTCSISYHVEIKRLGDRYRAFVLTKWLSLGQGNSPLDPKWQRHLLYPAIERVPLVEGGILQLFEQQPGKSHKELTESNVSTLCNEGYRDTFLHQHEPWQGLWDDKKSSGYWAYQTDPYTDMQG